MKNVKWTPLLIVVSILGSISYKYFSQDSFNYFNIGCSLYGREGKLVYSQPGYANCDFSPEGLVLASEPAHNMITLFSQFNKIIWAIPENNHNSLKFSRDYKSFLVMTSEVINSNQKQVRSDCFSRRDLENHILAQWCVKDHLQELITLGFNLTETFIYPETKKAVHEVIPVNSINEIQANKRSSSNAAFSPGNYVINLFSPSGAVFILDHDMKKILWSKKMYQFVTGEKNYFLSVDDVQVAPDGLILAFVSAQSSNLDRRAPAEHSKIIKFDPNTNEFKWVYLIKNAEDLDPYNGSVTELRDAYVFVDNASGGRLFEINRKYKIFWTFVNPEIDPISKLPARINQLKLYKDSSFLKAHKAD